MKSKKIAKIVSIYSIVFCVASFIGQLSGETQPNVISILMTIAIFVLSIIILNKNKDDSSKEKGMMIVLLVFYSLLQFITLILLSYNALFGLISEVLIVVPFILCIMYLVRLSKENKEKSKSLNENNFDESEKDTEEEIKA